jgi:hypothetical protein
MSLFLIFGWSIVQIYLNVAFRCSSAVYFMVQEVTASYLRCLGITIDSFTEDVASTLEFLRRYATIFLLGTSQ